MPTLEPDAMHLRVFPHARDAIRAWKRHRDPDEGLTGALGRTPGGPAPTSSDVLRVGQVFVDMRLTRQQVVDLVEWAICAKPRSAVAVDGSASLEVLAAKVTRWLRAREIVAKSTPRVDRRHDEWQDSEGVTHKTTYCVDSV